MGDMLLLSPCSADIVSIPLPNKSHQTAAAFAPSNRLQLSQHHGGAFIAHPLTPTVPPSQVCLTRQPGAG